MYNSKVLQGIPRRMLADFNTDSAYKIEGDSVDLCNAPTWAFTMVSAPAINKVGLDKMRFVN